MDGYRWRDGRRRTYIEVERFVSVGLRLGDRL